MSIRNKAMRWIGCWLLIVACLPASPRGFAHGSIVDEGDVCLLTLGFYSAHFTIYQPPTRKQKEYCEDIPDVTETIFVMKFLHQSLREVPIEFRIIRDPQKRGRFVRWEDVQAMGDLNTLTVYYAAPALYPFGVLTLLQDFTQSGDYIGVVSTRHPTEAIEYHAVFPFHVGPPALGYWPWIIGLLVIVQVNWWWMGGGVTRWRRRKS